MRECDEPKNLEVKQELKIFIPMEDIFTGVTNFYPDNQLTKYLLDMNPGPNAFRIFLLI